MPKLGEPVQVKAPAQPKKPKLRSPNYPAVGLEKAIELATALHKQYGTHPVHLPLLHKLWKFKEGSNTANQYVAALKAYGLVTISGDGSVRMVAISKSGVRIVGDAPDRAELVKQAAIGPKIHKEILDHYGPLGLPADDLLERYLVWDRPEGQRFNPQFVKEFIERFKGTLAYAGVSSSDTISESDDPGTGDDEDDDQPPVPPLHSTRIQRSRKMTGAAAAKEDVYTLTEGDAILQWPASIGRASAEDLEAWLALVIRKIKRAADTSQNPSGDADEPVGDE